MKTNIITFTFRAILLFEVLWGANAWFTWGISLTRSANYVVLLAIAIIAQWYKKKSSIRLVKSSHLIFCFVCYLFAVLIYSRFSLPGLVGALLKLYPIWVLLSDRANIRNNIEFIGKGLAIILIPGIILFFIRNFVLLPGIPIAHPGSSSYDFLNHIFYIQNINSDIAARFNSIFLEPSYLGTLLSFILFAEKYDFSKWENKILLIGLVLSLSLASYIITLLGYAMYSTFIKREFRKVLVYVMLVVISYNISLVYNHGDNYLNNYIISRLQLDKEKGIVGNNRTGLGTDFYYEQAFDNGTIWMGLGQKKVNQINRGSSDSAGYDENIRGAGYKVYFLTRGILSALLFLLFYMSLGNILCPRSMLVRNSFVLLIVLTFFQAAYPESPSWLYPFVLGCMNYNIRN